MDFMISIINTKKSSNSKTLSSDANPLFFENLELREKNMEVVLKKENKKKE